MDVRLLGKKNEGEGLGFAVLVDSAFAELKDKSDEQLAEAQRFLIDFMKKVARLKGVRIDRPHFLRSELRRKGVHKYVGEFAVETTPVTAGIDVGLIDRIAREVIDYEAKRSQPPFPLQRVFPEVSRWWAPFLPILRNTTCTHSGLCRNWHTCMAGRPFLKNVTTLMTRLSTKWQCCSV